MAKAPTQTGENIPGYSASSVLPGASPGSGMGAYGGVPNIPNPIFSTGAALEGNIGQFPAMSNLAQMYNLANYNTHSQEIAGTPGYESVLSNLHGQLPQDVKNQLIQGAAERGVATGTMGSPNADAALLASLGLTSLDLQKLGQQQYGALSSLFPQAAPFDMQAFMTSPEQYQAAQTAANVNAAAPNPQMAADAELQALKDAIAAGKGSVPLPGGITGGQTTFPGGAGIPPGGATSYNPPAVAYGGGAPPNQGPTPYQWPQPQGQGGYPGTMPGFGSGLTGSGPSPQDWQGFLNALNPQSTATNTWFGMSPDEFDLFNSNQTPGFGGGPGIQDWEGFLNALNPESTGANTWFGMSPDEWSLFNSAPDQSAPASDWAQFESDYLNQFLESGGASSTPADTYGYDQGYGDMSDYFDQGGP